LRDEIVPLPVEVREPVALGDLAISCDFGEIRAVTAKNETAWIRSDSFGADRPIFGRCLGATRDLAFVELRTDREAELAAIDAAGAPARPRDLRRAAPPARGRCARLAHGRVRSVAEPRRAARRAHGRAARRGGVIPASRRGVLSSSPE